MKIRTWAERLNDFPDMQITTSMDIQMAMQAEIDELREALVEKKINYKMLHDFATSNNVDYTKLFVMVQNATGIHPSPFDR